MRKIRYLLKRLWKNFTVDRLRSKESKELCKFFIKKYPESNRQIFLQLSKISIDSFGLNEDPRRLSSETAKCLKLKFSALSEVAVRDWLFGLMKEDNCKFVERIQNA